MQRRKPSSLTPNNYAKAIISLSRRYSSTSAFPGNNYIGLAEWLIQNRGQLDLAEVSGALEEDGKLPITTHDSVVVYRSKDKKWDTQSYKIEDHQSFLSVPAQDKSGDGELVFVRGFISQAWLSALGSRYAIDPEFFRRHMDYLSANVDRHAFASPSLRSSSRFLFRVCVNTILHREDYGQKDVRMQRIQHAKQQAEYKAQCLGATRLRGGDSIVREYYLLCGNFSVVEQWISMCLTRTEAGFAVIAWMDHGRPLDQSPPGPWSADMQAKAAPLPILQHHPKMAFRTTFNRLDADANVGSDAPQSTSVIPLQYDSIMALVDVSRRAAHDPLAMCSPLFAHAAFSEMQLLNIMESRIQMQMDVIAAGRLEEALSTLQYLSNILNRHARQLQDTIRAISSLAEEANRPNNKPALERSRSKSLAPISIDDDSSDRGGMSSEKNSSASGSIGTYTEVGLLADHDQLYRQCKDLIALCTQGMNLAMNNATIEESRKAIEQSARVKRLTILATFFIPLNFCSSLFGMNVDVLGQGHVRFWWFFVLCVPLVFLAYILYMVDSVLLKQCWSWVRRQTSKLRRRRKSTLARPVDAV